MSHWLKCHAVFSLIIEFLVSVNDGNDYSAILFMCIFTVENKVLVHKRLKRSTNNEMTGMK